MKLDVYAHGNCEREGEKEGERERGIYIDIRKEE